MKTAVIKKVDLFAVGIIDTPIDMQKEKDLQSPTGYFWRMENIGFTKSTHIIPAKIGTAFGIKYFLHGIEDELVEFECKIMHPSLSNPHTGETFSQTFEKKSNWLNTEGFDFFIFEEDWEIQLGKWQFTIEQQGKVFLDFTFNIVEDNDLALNGINPDIAKYAGMIKIKSTGETHSLFDFDPASIATDDY